MRRRITEGVDVDAALKLFGLWPHEACFFENG